MLKRKDSNQRKKSYRQDLQGCRNLQGWFCVANLGLPKAQSSLILRGFRSPRPGKGAPIIGIKEQIVWRKKEMPEVEDLQRLKFQQGSCRGISQITWSFCHVLVWIQPWEAIWRLILRSLIGKKTFHVESMDRRSPNSSRFGSDIGGEVWRDVG